MFVRRISNRVYGDFLMPSGLGTFRRLLESTLRAGYESVSVERFWRLIVAGDVDPGRRYLIVRHDIDTDPRTGAQMWEIERRLGITGSYYFRQSTLDLDLMGAIARDGGEVSYHYEELATLAKRNRLRDQESVLRQMPEAQDLFCRNLETLRGMTGLPMRVVSSHGDFANRYLGIPNWAILVDQRARRDAGVDLEVYDEDFVRHLSANHSDTDYPRRWTPRELSVSLEARVPVLCMLVHPRNWQARPIDNVRDDLRRLTEGILFRLPPSSRAHTLRPRTEAGHGRIAEEAGSASQRSAVPEPRRGPEITPPIRASASSSSSERALMLVRAPAAREIERRYVLDVVLAEWLGLDYTLIPHDEAGVSMSLDGDERGAILTLPDVLFATPEADWLTARSMPSTPLPRMSVDPRVAGSAAFPILFAERGTGTTLFRTTSDGVAFTADLFGSVFYMLTRYEEVARPFRDDHDRFPNYASLAQSEGFVEQPIVDVYVDALWAAMHRLWPRLRRPSPGFRLRLTHDVDRPSAAVHQPASAALRSLAGDLVRRRDLDLARRRTASLVGVRKGRVQDDPYDTFELLMETSERYGSRSTFYFLAGNTAGAIDGNYQLSDPPIQRLLRRIHERGHDVGLHASYNTYQSPELIQREFTALKVACAAAGFEQPSWGVRQHYLRFEVPTTWRHHERAGLEHDSTLGFADHIGFRAGTGREFPTYDLLERRTMKLRERPLVVMDATLFGYMGLGLDDAATAARAVVAECRRYGTDAVLCYHNSSLAGMRDRAHYQDLVADLLDHARS